MTANVIETKVDEREGKMKKMILQFFDSQVVAAVDHNVLGCSQSR